MRRITITALTLLLFATLFSNPATARLGHQRGWESLGELSVSNNLDHDILPVTVLQGTFRAIRIQVFDRPVEFRAVRIHFGNGETQDVALRRIIRAGDQTRIIDINGRDRVIQSIEFLYDAEARSAGDRHGRGGYGHRRDRDRYGDRQARVRVLGRN